MSLREGAPLRVGLVCPGAPLTRAIADQLAAFIRAEFGEAMTLQFHEQCFLEAGHFAGDDETRARAFVETANDPAIDAIWFAKGGYGAMRLAPATLAKLQTPAREKTYLGYSDAGALLAWLDREGVGRCVHGPMAVDIARPGGERAVRRAARFLLGAQDGLEPSLARGGPALAFNATVLAHIIAGPYAPRLAGRTLMLEDVGEHHYRLDRAFGAILLSPLMRGAAGLRIGRFSAIPENDRPFGADIEAIARYWCARAGVAFLGEADIGHDADNKIVPFAGASVA